MEYEVSFYYRVDVAHELEVCIVPMGKNKISSNSGFLDLIGTAFVFYPEIVIVYNG